MKQALFVDCCIRGELSRTKKLADAFFRALGEDYEVTHLKLEEENLSYFTHEAIDSRQVLLDAGELSHPRFRYAHQFSEADLIVIAAPFWDLSFPALLKVYIEQISVDGITFQSTADGLKGLCRAENLVFLTTRGGFYEGGAMEMGSRYLDALHDFFGVKHYHCVAADGMDVAGFDGETSLQDAIARAKVLAKSL